MALAEPQCPLPGDVLLSVCVARLFRGGAVPAPNKTPASKDAGYSAGAKMGQPEALTAGRLAQNAATDPRIDRAHFRRADRPRRGLPAKEKSRPRVSSRRLPPLRRFSRQAGFARSAALRARSRRAGCFSP